METRGIVFVHYYNLRSAERAKRDCENIMIGGRNLDIHYSVPKDDIRVVKCDRTKNQGTLLLSLNGSQSALVDSELYDYFKQFGDIKVIRTPTFKTSSENTERWQRFVEFYDSRAAVAAADATHGKSYKNGKWDVTYFWDQGPRERRDISPSRRGDRTRRSDPRSNRHDRDRYDDHHRRGRHTSPPPRHSSSSHWNPPPSSISAPAPAPLPVPTSNSIVDQSQLEKSQKAQQLLTLLSQLQSGQSQVPAPAPALAPAPSSIYSQPVANNLPISAPPPISAAPTGPPPQNQNQIQQLLGILSQMSGNATQQQQQQPLQPQPQQTLPQTQSYPTYQLPYQQQQQQQYQPQPQQPQPLQQHTPFTPHHHHHQQQQPLLPQQQQHQSPQQHATYSPYNTISTHDPNSHPPYNP
ncbi:unnamed protein product [Cunninghamella echinulata]